MKKQNREKYVVQNPFNDIKKTFMGTIIPTTITVIISLVLGIFLSGLIYQYIAYTFGKMRRFEMMNSFYYGINRTFIVSIIIAFAFFYAYYKMLRMFEGRKVDYETGIIRSDNQSFGNAHWQTEEELKVNFDIYNKIGDTDKEILAQDSKGRVYCLKYPPGMNHNKVYFGAPGSAKSAAVVKTDLYQALLRGESVIVTDSKGDIYAQTSSVARELGYVVKVLNIKDQEFQNSNAMNVMAFLNPESPTFSSDCAVISNIIMKQVLNLKGNEVIKEHWDVTGTKALQMVIMLLSSRPEYINSGQNNLYSVYMFLSTKSPEEMRQIFTSLPMTNPTRIVYNNFAIAKPENQASTINGVTNLLGMLNNTTLGKVLSFNEIDFVLPMKRKCIYYVIMQDNDDTYKFIASLFFTTIFKRQSDYSDSLTDEQKKKQLTVNYILDEYKNWGGVNGLDSKASTVRSRKINLTIILQLMEQLITVHGEEGAKEILNNCTVKGLLSTNDPDTAKYISDLTGQYTMVVPGEKYEESRTDSAKAHNNVKKSEMLQGRPLVYPADLMNEQMMRDDIIFIIANEAPVRLKKCFAEKAGVPIHPLEIHGVELGVRKSNRYRPAWRKKLEEAEANKQVVTVKPTVSPAVSDTKMTSATIKNINDVVIKPVEKPKVVLREVTNNTESVSEQIEPAKTSKPKAKDVSAAEKLNMLLNGDL